MLKKKIERFLKDELGDWSDFIYQLEDYDDTQIKVEIRNDTWEVESTMYFTLDSEQELCLYLCSENWQKIDILNYNKFFWIELLAVR